MKDILFFSAGTPLGLWRIGPGIIEKLARFLRKSSLMEFKIGVD